MKKTFIYITALFLVVLTTESCRKEGCTDPKATNYNEKAKKDDGSCELPEEEITDAGNTSSGAASATSTATQEDMAIYNFVSNSAENGEATGKTTDTTWATSGCATMSLQSNGPLQWPKTLTIDFGTSGCVGFDGKSRKGKIIATYNADWRTHQVNDSITVTLQNYSVNDTTITGTRYFWITNSSVITNGTMTINYKSENVSINYPDGNSVSWAANGTIDISGLNTPVDYTDDQFELDFTASGTTVDNNPFNSSTPIPLLSKMNCINTCTYVKGSLKITTTTQSETTQGNYTVTLDNDVDITLDFGDGTCDGTFDLTVGVVSTMANSDVEVYSTTIGPTSYACGGLNGLSE